MKKYDNYKDSGVEWMGEIPSHWDITRIGINSELTVPQRDKPKDLDGPIPWLRIEDFDGKYVSSSKTNQGVTQETVDSMNLKVYPVGTVLTACSCTMGMTAIVEKPLITNQTFIGITPKDNLNSVYLYYFFKASTQYLNSISTGAIQSYLSRSEFSKLRIPKISLNEQIQIANYLDHKTSQIDHLIAKKEQFIKLLEEERVAVINQAVTKGLDPNVPMKDSGVEWLGEIPEHWEVRKIGHITKVIRGASPRPAGDPLLFNGDFLPWITVKEVTNAIGRFITSTETYLTELGSFQTRVLEPETLILSNSGATLGVPRITLIRGGINDGSVAFLNLNIERDFLYYFFTTHTNIYREEASGYGQPNLNTEIVKSTKVPLPSVNEQIEIIKFIEKELIRFDLIINKSRQEIELLKEYKTALISEVVTGKVDVSTSSTQA